MQDAKFVRSQSERDAVTSISMDHVFRVLLSVLSALLLFQLFVYVIIATRRTKTPKIYASGDDVTSAPAGRVVTGPSRMVPKKTAGEVEAGEGWGIGALLGWLLGRRELPVCSAVPPYLVGPLDNSYSLLSYARLADLYPSLEPGGLWRPSNCSARHRVALVVPYRDRDDHLRIFLHNIHAFLQRQQIDYGVYVVEQSPRGNFNRGMLFNIGFVESLRFADYDCFVFHDVDLLPEDDRNLYWCPVMPRHLSAAVDTLFYKLPYDTLFGGVEAFTREHFELINGFSNRFFGWGGEDDDLYQRLIFHKLNLTRYPLSIARYRMLRHLKMNPNPRRLDLVQNGPERFEQDGLNSLRYVLRSVERRKLYTWIYVDIDESILSGGTKKEDDASQTLEFAE